MAVNEEALNSTEKELNKYLKQLVKQNLKRNVALRGVINGIFTAIGTTIGFGLLIIIVAFLVSNLKQLPVVDSFLADTKLDLLIEYQLQKIKAEIGNGTISASNSSASSTSDYQTYNSGKYAYTLKYPVYFDEVTELPTGNNSVVVDFSGQGTLSSLEIRVNDLVDLTGNKTQYPATTNAGEQLIVNIYNNGAAFDNKNFTQTVFELELVKGSNTFQFIGVADSDTPKLAREQFLTILQTLEFAN